MTKSVLEVRKLCTSFTIDGKSVEAIKDVSFSVSNHEMLGIVGESGSGKSVTALTTMGLIKYAGGTLRQGQILLGGEDLATIPESLLRKIRGRRIAMIFQDPMTSLNPVFTVGFQIMEVLRIHSNMNKSQARSRAVELLELVQIPSAERRIDEYPHQLSGGMRQRVMIAMALACEPEVLIADEPTTALDVTIQAQILDLIKGLQERIGMAVVLITHDLGVVAEYCDNVLVMYGGRIVEQGSTREIFEGPKHPYTKGLLLSVPKLGQRQTKLKPIPGHVPPLGAFPAGCRFANRCHLVTEDCHEAQPPLVKISGSHFSACIRSEDV